MVGGDFLIRVFFIHSGIGGAFGTPIFERNPAFGFGGMRLQTGGAGAAGGGAFGAAGGGGGGVADDKSGVERDAPNVNMLIALHVASFTALELIFFEITSTLLERFFFPADFLTNNSGEASFDCQSTS